MPQVEPNYTTTRAREPFAPFDYTRQVGTRMATIWKALNLQTSLNEVKAFVISSLARIMPNSSCDLKKKSVCWLFRICKICHPTAVVLKDGQREGLKGIFYTHQLNYYQGSLPRGKGKKRKDGCYNLCRT